MKQIIILISIFVTFTLNAQQNNNKDSLYCQLRDFLIIESKVDTSLNCMDAILINDILTDKLDLNQNFGVFAFSSRLIADDFFHYLVKYKNDYFVFSAKDPMLVTNKLLELQEKFPDEIDIKLVIQYIKKIGKTRASNMTTYMVVLRKIGNLKYIYALSRYK